MAFCKIFMEEERVHFEIVKNSKKNPRIDHMYYFTCYTQEMI